jgi:hypothetical protein
LYGSDDVAGFPFGPTAREASENDHDFAVTATIDTANSAALNKGDILVLGLYNSMVENYTFAIDRGQKAA